MPDKGQITSIHRPIVGVTMLAVAIEGIAAWREGVLMAASPRHPKLSFLAHGGMWGDFFIFSIINGLLWSHLRHSPQAWTLTLVPAFGLTLWFHALWGADKTLVSHMWPDHASGSWLKDLGIAGWIHVVFMAWELAVLALFAFSPAPAATVWFVAILLTIFWPLGALQPGKVVTGQWIDQMRLVTSILMVGGTWAVSLIKLFLLRQSPA